MCFPIFFPHVFRGNGTLDADELCVFLSSLGFTPLRSIIRESLDLVDLDHRWGDDGNGERPAILWPFVGHGQSAFLRGKWAMVHSYWKGKTNVLCDTIARKLLIFVPSFSHWTTHRWEDVNGVLDFEETVILMHVYRWELGDGFVPSEKGLGGGAFPVAVADEATKLSNLRFYTVQYPFWWGTVVNPTRNHPHPHPIF